MLKRMEELKWKRYTEMEMNEKKKRKNEFLYNSYDL